MSAKDIANRDGLKDAKAARVALKGGKLVKITPADEGTFLTPKDLDGEEVNPHVSGIRPGWSSHIAVEKGGRTYDNFTGRGGLPLNEYLQKVFGGAEHVQVNSVGTP